MSNDGAAAPSQTVRQPNLIWCFSRTHQEEVRFDSDLPPSDHPFRWLHLNLSDQRSLRWLKEESGLPPSLQAMLLTRSDQQVFLPLQDAIGLILHDLERGLDPHSIGHIGALHIVVTPGLMVTGRYKALHSGDLLRERLEAGADVHDAPTALRFLLSTHTDALGLLVLDLTNQVLELEARVLGDEGTVDTRALMHARRRAARLHRMIGGLHTTLQRMEQDPFLPASFDPIPKMLMPRLVALDADVLNNQGQLRMLRDEIDLEATQRTNDNVYLLSILTALVMPATLVTGFFGMNTSGMPLATGEHGTLIATMIALFSGALSYWLLKMMGLIRRG